MKPNRMKERIARGEATLGCTGMRPWPQIVEVSGSAGAHDLGISICGRKVAADAKRHGFAATFSSYPGM